MSLKRVAGNLLIRSFTLRWHSNPLSFNRQINTTAHVYGRGISRVAKNLNLTEREAEDFTPDDFEELTDPTVEDVRHHTSNLDGDAAKYQQFIQQKTIKQKYFKEYEPKEENLLTWEMKEQLKYLHATDPDEWTPEALAVAFPVSALGVIKLLKSSWGPANEAVIERHDKAVLTRWRKLTNGRLGSAKLLEEALRKKLGGRGTDKLPIPIMDPKKMMTTLESLHFENYERPKIPNATLDKKIKPRKIQKMKSGSFVSIIENYEAQVSPNKGSEINQSVEKDCNTPKHIDASLVTSGPPEYEGTYSQVFSKKSTDSRRRRGISRNDKKMMTLDQFLKTKSLS